FKLILLNRIMFREYSHHHKVSLIFLKDCSLKEFYLNVKTNLIGTEGTRLLREKWLQGRIPQAQKAPKRRIARGKRVPYAPINDQILQTLKKSKKHE
ncbi:hypothetical protein P4646_24480, partial [Peribacillus simplex]|uniref:hypothetical protein n=1 Tax=Peribacillus simplex TaxID=1478 RepID=UPI002E226AEC|nr:hypothetical protein [Peribacillus simplex]